MNDYRCPGARYRISRAVHLARLVSYYPPCRTCESRRDDDGLSARAATLVRQFLERPPLPPIFRAGEISGLLPNAIDEAVAARLGKAFGSLLRQAAPPNTITTVQQRSGNDSPHRFAAHNPRVLVAHDGRPRVLPLAAALADGLRWAGCDVVDGGPATAASVLFALGAGDRPSPSAASPGHASFFHGGVLCGRSGEEPHHVAIRLYPSSDGCCAALQRMMASDVARPTRSFGAAEIAPIDPPFLAALAPLYHGLRPLRYAVHATSRVLVRQLEKLNQNVDCRVLEVATAAAVAGEIVRQNADFGVLVDRDGLEWQFLDERGHLLNVQAVETLFEHRPPHSAPIDAAMAVTLLLRALSESDRTLSERCRSSGTAD